MVASNVPAGLFQFVDDELLRAPLLFYQLVDDTVDELRKGMAGMQPLQRRAVAELMHALPPQRDRLADYFQHSLREQTSAEVQRHDPTSRKDGKPVALALVDDDTVALDVELSHAIEAIKSTAEYELQELATFISALVGDMDVAADHNPFRPETWARALWAASQALPLSRGHQVTFVRTAGKPLAQLLRRSYAAASSRLEALGIEPAAYRTLILPSGSRRGHPRSGETTYSPDLHSIRETMPATLDASRGASLTYEGQQPGKPKLGREHWSDVARDASSRVDRQSIELVSRLFEAIQADRRVPPDVALLVARLHGPAMRLTLRDSGMLDHQRHPLWRFIDRLAYEAEMVPDPADPERAHLLKQGQVIVAHLLAETEQSGNLYRSALDRLETFLNKRLTRRIAAAASQIGALQKLEDKLENSQAQPSTLHGMLDVPQLDTVPAELFDELALRAAAPSGAEAWLDSLAPGAWVRLFLQGRWRHARLLWPGERREIWLFGDGASDATWAVRRNALLTLQQERLAKTLTQRSIVSSAANRVHEQMNSTAAA